MDAFTPRNAIKYVVKSAIHIKTARLTERTIVDHTSFEEDDFVVDISSNLVGWYVSDKLKPYTDVVVDKTADKVAEFRANRAAKKNTDNK